MFSRFQDSDYISNWKVEEKIYYMLSLLISTLACKDNIGLVAESCIQINCGLATNIWYNLLQKSAPVFLIQKSIENYWPLRINFDLIGHSTDNDIIFT